MDHLLYALAWLLFGFSHSALAGGRLSCFGRWQRIAYNLIAVTLFALVAAVGAAMLGDEPAFAMPAWLKGILVAVHVVGWLVLLGSARYYDLGRLAGTAQLRGETADEGLRTDGPHAFIRHPLYAGGYLILWGAALSPLGLATAVWGSLYLATGTACEERRLLRLFGSAYADYRTRVPALVPWRGRAL